jgi:hypothetical protein
VAAFVGLGLFGRLAGEALGEDDGDGDGNDDADGDAGDAGALGDAALDGVSQVPASCGEAVPHPAAATASVAARGVRSRR